VLEPVGNAITAVEEGIGDAAFDATGSPLLGALGQASPTAALSALGAAPLRRAAKTAKKAKALLKQASPSIKALKTEARNIYKQIDDSGAEINA